MVILKQAIVGPYKFTISDEYLAITEQNTGNELVVINRDEAEEVVKWLDQEMFGGVYKAVYPSNPFPEPSSEFVIGATKPMPGPVYEPGERTASQTVELRLGDPNLAYAGGILPDGRKGIHGVGVTDLGAASLTMGKV